MELEKMAPQMAATAVMMMMCHFHFRMTCTKERLLKLLSIVVCVVFGVLLLGVKNEVSLSVMFLLRGCRDRVFLGLSTKKAPRSVIEDDAEDEEQEGAQDGDDHDEPTHGIAFALGLEGGGDHELVRDELSGVDLGFLVFRLNQRELQAVVV